MLPIGIGHQITGPTMWHLVSNYWSQRSVTRPENYESVSEFEVSLAQQIIPAIAREI